MAYSGGRANGADRIVGDADRGRAHNPHCKQVGAANIKDMPPTTIHTISPLSSISIDLYSLQNIMKEALIYKKELASIKEASPP